MFNLAIGHLISLTMVGLVMATPGARVPFFLFIAAGCVLFTLMQSRAVRIWAVIATLVTLALAGWEHWDGMSEQSRLREAFFKSVLMTPKGAEPTREERTSEPDANF